MTTTEILANYGIDNDLNRVRGQYVDVCERCSGSGLAVRFIARDIDNIAGGRGAEEDGCTGCMNEFEWDLLVEPETGLLLPVVYVEAR